VPPIENGTVTVDGTRIAFVGPRREAPKGNDVDLGDAVLLPGLVNAHTHLELTAMRGLLEGLEFVEWIRTLTAARMAVLDDTAMLDSARAGIGEGLLAGITTYADTCSSGVSLHAMREMGVRGIMYQEVFGPAP
jgi:cytosine/adenosine deaminase-related metal-dependent hydrolase